MLETKMDESGKYIVKQIKIGEATTVMAIDEKGNRFFAVNNFFKNVLFYSDNVSDIMVKTNFVRSMLMITYEDFNIKKPVSVWFITEDGLKERLQKVKIVKRGDYQIRSRGLYNASIFLGITPKTNYTPTKINVRPDLTNYSLYERICLTHDKTITNLTVWKMCRKCRKYFPDNPKYYKLVKGETNICAGCMGKRIKLDNPVLDALFKYKCDEVVEDLYFERFEDAGKKLKKKIEEVGMWRE